MSEAPERPEDLRAQHAAPREEAALPVAASSHAAPAGEAQLKQRTTLRVIGGTLVLTIVMSAVLEYAGWQIAFRSMPEPHAPIPILPFLRGVWDTSLGSVGFGAAGVVGALLLPSTWRNAWRRLPAAFAMGAGAFIAFLSFVTFGFFG